MLSFWSFIIIYANDVGATGRWVIASSLYSPAPNQDCTEIHFVHFRPKTARRFLTPRFIESSSYSDLGELIKVSVECFYFAVQFNP